jgi:hypothetical protein
MRFLKILRLFSNLLILIFFLESIHETILMKRITNLNSSIDHFAFECQTNQIWAQVHDYKTKVKCYVTMANFY